MLRTIPLTDDQKLAACHGAILWPDGDRYPHARAELLDALDADDDLQLSSAAVRVLVAACDESVSHPALTDQQAADVSDVAAVLEHALEAKP